MSIAQHQQILELQGQVAELVARQEKLEDLVGRLADQVSKLSDRPMNLDSPLTGQNLRPPATLPATAKRGRPVGRTPAQ